MRAASTSVLTILTLTFVSGLEIARPAFAQTPPAANANAVDVGALVDFYFDYFSTRPTGEVPYRNFDTRHNQFTLAMAEVWLAKTPTPESRAGFKLKLGFGPAATNFIHAAEPGGQAFQNVQEAFGSYLLAPSRGLQLDAGIFFTPIGAEVIEAKDNDNYSRGLVFTLAEPYYHAGLRLSYAPTPKLTLMGGVVNGWNNVVDNNRSQSVIASVTVRPSASFTIAENYVGGPEQSDSNKNWRHLSDLILTWTISKTVRAMATYDAGRERFGSGAARWQGAGAYLSYQPTPSVALTPRVEFYDDASGATTGRVQKLKEGTLTFEVRSTDRAIWRLEYRVDDSNEAVYLDGAGGARRRQQSIGFGLLFAFAGKIQ